MRLLMLLLHMLNKVGDAAPTDGLRFPLQIQFRGLLAVNITHAHITHPRARAHRHTRTRTVVNFLQHSHIVQITRAEAPFK